MRNTRVIIHLDRLRHNLRLCRKIAGSREICAAMKADAYGHGARACAALALEEGISSFGLASAQEAWELRDSFPQARLLLYSPPHPADLGPLVQAGIEIFCTSKTELELLAKAAEATKTKALVHLKIDTGMGRIGMAPADYLEILRLARSLGDKLTVRGTCTHFPLADSPDCPLSPRQIQSLADCAAGARGAGLEPGQIHCANSAAMLRFPGSHMDMVRPGIVIYGYPGVPWNERPAMAFQGNPDPAVPHGWPEDRPFLPVMEVRSRISTLKEVAPGTGISYGHRWRSPGWRWIATVQAGYADGIPRQVSNRLEVSLAKGVHPQVGSICMDQFMVDLGPSRDSGGRPLPCRARLWEELTIFGGLDRHSLPNSPTARDLAEASGTIPYQICCDINSRIPREYLDSGDPGGPKN